MKLAIRTRTGGLPRPPAIDHLQGVEQFFDCGSHPYWKTGERGRIFPKWRQLSDCNNCGAEYHRTDEKFLVPHTGHASCTICGDTLEYWVENTHFAIFELVTRPDGSPNDAPKTP